MTANHHCSRLVPFAAGVLALVLAAAGAASADPADKETTTTLVASSNTISLGDSVTLSGDVTWDDGGTRKGVKSGTVTVKRGDATCSAESLEDVDSKTFVNDDADTGATFSVVDTPAAADTYGYLAAYGGGPHSGGNDPIMYTPSVSSCIQVSVTSEELRDAPAWANEYMRSDDFDEAACLETWGSNYHGEVIRRIADEFEGQSFATWEAAETAGVFTAVDRICTG